MINMLIEGENYLRGLRIFHDHAKPCQASNLFG